MNFAPNPEIADTLRRAVQEAGEEVVPAGVGFQFLENADDHELVSYGLKRKDLEAVDGDLLSRIVWAVEDEIREKVLLGFDEHACRIERGAVL